MRSIIFANYLARDTMRLGPTLGVENSHVRFLGNLVLNLWDCGGQDAFMENYFESQRDQIFRHVEVLIYVFDIESHERKKDLEQFDSCLTAIRQNSKNAHIFCLIHKMDLVREEERGKTYEERSNELKKMAAQQNNMITNETGGGGAGTGASSSSSSSSSTSGGLKLTTFGTSIWDETLYKAWSSIVYALVPNIDILESQLSKFCRLCGADEVVLFEKATFLVISHSTLKPHSDIHRYEKISNIIKQFKLSCSKTQSQFKSMEVKNKNFTAFIDVFTTNTYVMIIISNPTLQSAAININIQVARPHFEKFVQQNMY